MIRQGKFGPWIGQWMEVPATNVTGQKDTDKESVAECERAERFFSLTIPAWFKQTDNFYFNNYFHVGEFSLKLCIHSCGVSMSPCICAWPCA